MPLMYLTSIRAWHLYDVWDQKTDADAILIDIPDDLCTRWDAVKTEISAIQVALQNLSDAPTIGIKPPVKETI
jgi:hypothetical protein